MLSSHWLDLVEEFFARHRHHHKLESRLQRHRRLANRAVSVVPSPLDTQDSGLTAVACSACSTVHVASPPQEASGGDCCGICSFL